MGFILHVPGTELKVYTDQLVNSHIDTMTEMFFLHHFTDGKVRLTETQGLELASGRARPELDPQESRAPACTAPHSLSGITQASFSLPV